MEISERIEDFTREALENPTGSALRDAMIGVKNYQVDDYNYGVTRIYWTWEIPSKFYWISSAATLGLAAVSLGILDYFQSQEVHERYFDTKSREYLGENKRDAASKCSARGQQLSNQGEGKAKESLAEYKKAYYLDQNENYRQMFETARTLCNKIAEGANSKGWNYLKGQNPDFNLTRAESAFKKALDTCSDDYERKSEFEQNLNHARDLIEEDEKKEDEAQEKFKTAQGLLSPILEEENLQKIEMKTFQDDLSKVDKLLHEASQLHRRTMKDKVDHEKRMVNLLREGTQHFGDGNGAMVEGKTSLDSHDFDNAQDKFETAATHFSHAHQDFSKGSPYNSKFANLVQQVIRKEKEAIKLKEEAEMGSKFSKLTFQPPSLMRLRSMVEREEQDENQSQHQRVVRLQNASF